MKKLSILALAAVLICSCHQVPRNTVQEKIPLYKVQYKAPVVETISGPEAKAWDELDRVKAVAKYNKMTAKDKKILFDTITRVYTSLPKNTPYSSELINTGIWKEVTDKGVDLSFGDEAADWHPYIMYIHPVVVGEFSDYKSMVKDGSISHETLNLRRRALRNLINAEPDSITMASLLLRQDELDEVGLGITRTGNTYKASTRWVSWNKYRTNLAK